MKNIRLFALLFLFSSVAQSQDISGDWYGNLKVSGMEIPLVFHIEKNDQAYSSTMDSPNQGAFGLKAGETSFENSSLKILVPAAGITYEGSYKELEEIIEGTFKQGGMDLPLNLSRQKQKVTETAQPLRPQEPKAPFPYRSEDITFTNSLDSIILAGTLTLPKEPGKYPAVVLISGSGAQDRNSEIVGHKPFLVLADHLTKNGIAVLRFDERGVKESQGDFSKATSKDFATDVEAALDFLKSRREIDNNKIGLIGHSEGGFIAPMVAENTKEVDFLVLLAGPALRGDKNLLLQKKLLEERMDVDELTVDQGQKIFREAYDIIMESEGEDLQSNLEDYFEKEFKGQMDENQINSLARQLTSPWMQFYLKHDPSPALEKIDVPVLALFGQNDFQVPPSENSKIVKESLEKAGNDEVQVIVFENLNHLFQESATGLPNEYAQIEQTISPDVLKVISNWILEQN